MTEYIFPTNKCVGDTPPVNIETRMTDWVDGMKEDNNFIHSGMAPTISGSDVNVATGTAIIAGYVVTISATETVTPNNSESDQHWYLQLQYTTSKVSSYQWTRVVSPALDGSDDPTDSVKVFICDKDGGGTISNLRSVRRGGHCVQIGDYGGDGTSGQAIDIGFQPTLIIVAGSTKASASPPPPPYVPANDDWIYAFSNICVYETDGTSSTELGFYCTYSSGNYTEDITTQNYWRPMLRSDGFYVAVHPLGLTSDLNQSGATYHYVAFG